MPARVRSGSVDDLFARFRATGDPALLGRVYDRTASELQRAARRLAVDRAAAEDLVQATFVRAIERAGSYDPERPVLPWLVGILYREARTLRWRRSVLRRATRRASASGARPSGERDWTSDSPIDHAVATERRAAIDAAVATLPSAYRSILNLHVRNGLGATEIARALGSREATVRSQLARARRLLSRILPAGLGVFVCARAGRAAPVASGAARRGLAAASAAAIVLLTVAALAEHDAPTAGAPMVAAAVGTPAGRAPAPARAAESPALRAPIELEPTHHAAHVDVRYDDGSAAAGVHVLVRPLGVADPCVHERWVETDGAGRLRLDRLPSGTLELRVDRGGSARLEGAPRVAAHRLLTIPRGYTIHGRVTDEAARPVAGARIWLSGEHDHTEGRAVTVADRTGAFEIRSVTGRRLLRAAASGFATREMAEVGARVGESVQVAVVLNSRVGTVRGVVVDPAGAPVADARVILDESALGPPAAMPATSAARTDAAGRFEFDGVLAGPTTLTAVAPGWRAAASRIDVEAAASSECRLQLRAGATVHGRVLGCDGRPAGGVWVSPCDDGELLGRGVRTDGDGRYRLEGLDRAVVLQIRSERFGVARREPAPLPPGAVIEWSPRLTDVRRVEASGVVTDRRGEPLCGWSVQLLPQRSARRPGDRRHRATTDRDGRFSVRCPATGPHRVIVAPPGSPFSCRFDAGWLLPGERCTVSVPDPALPRCGLRARFVDEEGRAVRDVRVVVSQPDSLARLAASAGSDGVFMVDGLPAGPYEVEALAPGFGARRVANLVVAADAATLDIGRVTLGRARQVVFRLSDPGSTVLWTVTRKGGARRLASIRADGDVAWLCAGEFVARAQDRAGGLREEFSVDAAVRTDVWLPAQR